MGFAKSSTILRGRASGVSALVEAHDRRFGERIEVELKPDHGGRRIRGGGEAFAANGKYREQITVRMIALRRARAAVAGGAEVSAGLQRSLGQLRSVAVAGTGGELGHVGRNVHHNPVPKSAAGRRVGIEAGDRKTLGPGWRSRPSQVRRFVAA